LTEAHKHLISQWKQSCQVIEKQEKDIKNLTQEKEALSSSNANLKEEVTLLNSRITNITEYVRKLNKGTGMLEHAFETGRSLDDKTGLGFDKHSKEKHKVVPEKTTLPKKKSQE
jgi:predicted  nucleic acid-binding Zn-ribbon protein